MYRILFSLFIFLSFAGCKSTVTYNRQSTTPTTEKTLNNQEYSIQAVLWQQQAAEYKALTFQAYYLAKLHLNNILDQQDTLDKPLAIVTDIDETVLDNSPFNGEMIETDSDYNKDDWIKWGQLQMAEGVPGAHAFFTYAASKGVEVFYISNRYSTQQPETIANLKKLDFPYADTSHVLLRTTTSGKEPRRAIVEQTHSIIMLLGDNLSDFSAVFDNKNTQQRNVTADSLQALFGNKFIVLPNAMYGDWDTKGILEGRYNWTAKQKDSIRRSKIKSF